MVLFFLGTLSFIVQGSSESFPFTKARHQCRETALNTSYIYLNIGACQNSQHNCFERY